MNIMNITGTYTQNQLLKTPLKRGESGVVKLSHSGIESPCAFFVADSPWRTSAVAERGARRAGWVF